MRSHNKVYLSSIFFAIMIISGCNPVAVPLKGKYNADPLEIISTKSIDSTWSALTDLFSANGLPVKKAEKTKGQIISGKTSFIAVYSFENADGQIQSPQAWVVLPKAIVNKQQWVPKRIYSQWS
ncbi:MAG: hypothetical protein ABUT20_56430, partial [Bacteroidota bacterium]